MIRTQHFLLRCRNKFRQPRASLMCWKGNIRNPPARWQMYSPLLLIGRGWMVMYESFFGMKHTPFVRDIPAEKLYESDAFREMLSRLCYGSRPTGVCDRNSRSRLWKIHSNPQVLFGTSEGRIYHPVSF